MSKGDRHLREWFEQEQRNPRQSVLQALDSLNLRSGDRIADVGCGPGVHLPQFLKRIAPGGQAVGIDTSPERLEIARVMLSEEVNRGTVDLVHGDLHDLDPKLGEFDLIWMSLVLHHEPIPVDVISGLRTRVRPGGRIAILDGDDLASFPFLSWSPELEITIRRAVVRAAEDEHESGRRFGRRFTARSLPAILADAGLTDVQFRAFADVQTAPLDDWKRNELRTWFIESLGQRIRDYLSPIDWREYEAHFNLEAPECILTRPDFFMVRTWFLGVGTSA